MSLLFVLATLGTPLRATTFESGDAQVTLLELYTSEGCSSCPPAEAKLAQLKDAPELWKRVVPVTFHVDYWDRLGWSDRFASAVFTQRQYGYASQWHNGTVYTPAFVQNGREGNDLGRPSKPGHLRVEINDSGEAHVMFLPTNMPLAGLVVEAAPLASGVTSDVRRGENAGHKLVHEFVALDLVRAPLEHRGGAWTATLALPSRNVAPAAALAAWVHATDDLTPIQAVGGWLPK